MFSCAVYLWISLKYQQAWHKWMTVPDAYYVLGPVLAAVFGFLMIFWSLYKGFETAPLFWSAVTVSVGFMGLSACLYPNMIPHVVSPVTVEQAAASRPTLIFMLVVMGVLLPVIFFYTSYTYRVFRGKVVSR